jgi:putative peptidoglycan lipid II flippase
MFAFLRAHAGQHRILGGAAVLAVTQAAASVAGLFRDRLLNSTFSDLSVVDAYIASFRPSDLLFQLTVMSGIATVLVPLLARAHAKGDESSKLLSSVMGLGSLAFGAIALVGGVFFPYIAPVFVDFDQETMALYVQFGRLALLTNVLFVCGNSLGQYLVTMQRYWLYGLTPVLYTLGTIAGTLWLTPTYGALGPMLGTVAGAIIYVIIRFAGAMHAGYRPSFRLWHPELSTMGALMLPRMAALAVLQLQLLLFDTLASGLPAGSVTVNSNARNFQSFVVGVIGIALAQSAFPLMSQAAAKGEADRFRMYVRKGLAMIVGLTIPAGIVLVLATPIAVRLVHLEDVYAPFAAALMMYALSIPFESLNHLILRSYYALHVTALPAVMSVVNGALAIAAAWLLAPYMGVQAIPLGFLIGQSVSLVGLLAVLPLATKRTLPAATA